MEKPVIWSYGGGVQSVAILVLILQGRLPKPERIVMADTGRERQAVWDYTEKVVRPAMNKIGLDLEVVPHDYSKVDIMSHKGKLLIPAFTPGDGRNGGKMRTFCSDEWKKQPVRRYLRDVGYGPARPKKKIRMWIGMSLDEATRMKQADVQWIEHYYPLCQDDNVKMSRQECASLIDSYGWIQPPASACWMCPNRDDKTWLEIKTHEPKDFAKAAKFERVINGVGWGDVYLHRNLVPIDQVDFDEDKEQMSLFDECSYTCWT